MQASISKWVSQLERRFKKNLFEACCEADALKFCFITEQVLPLQEYIKKKVMLLQEANIVDEQEIV